MKVNRMALLSERVLFFLWYLTFIALAGYAFLANRNKLPIDGTYLNLLVNVNIISGGISFLIFTFKLAGRLISGKTLKRIATLIVILVIFLIGLTQLNRYGYIRLLSPELTFINSVGSVKSFYMTLFFDFFGYPADSQMGSSEEVFNQVNKFRTMHGLDPVETTDKTCQLAKERVTEVAVYGSYTQFEEIRFYPIADDRLTNSAAEITESLKQANSAENIVNLRWGRPFAKAREIITSPEWHYGCAAVLTNNAVFVFGKKVF